jgi:hypothetical protein
MACTLFINVLEEHFPFPVPDFRVSYNAKAVHVCCFFILL